MDSPSSHQHDDLYGVLGINPNATQSEIKQAYRKCCLKYHPDKNLDNKEAEKMFLKVSYAFSILSDENLRHKYNISDFKGLKDSTNQSCSTKYKSKDIFDKFFHDIDNPFSKMGLYDTTGFKSKERKKNDDNNDGEVHEKQQLKAKTVLHDLPYTLEELYIGAEKSIKVTRKRFSPNEGKLFDESSILRIKVQAGWRAGTQINMHGEGDEEEHRSAGDLIFTLKEIPHQHFQRDGSNNIIFNAEITLCEALTDCTIKIPTLRGKTLFVPCPEIVHSSYERRLIGEGLPSEEDPTSKGDLIIRFYIQFPKTLKIDTKKYLRDLLCGN